MKSVQKASSLCVIESFGHLFFRNTLYGRGFVAKILGNAERRLLIRKCKCESRKFVDFLQRTHSQMPLYRPEALGIAPGAVFLVCLIICLVGFATSHPSKVLIHEFSVLVCRNFVYSYISRSLNLAAFGFEFRTAFHLLHALFGFHR